MRGEKRKVGGKESRGDKNARPGGTSGGRIAKAKLAKRKGLGGGPRGVPTRRLRKRKGKKKPGSRSRRWQEKSPKCGKKEKGGTTCQKLKKRGPKKENGKEEEKDIWKKVYEAKGNVAVQEKKGWPKSPINRKDILGEGKPLPKREPGEFAQTEITTKERDI